MDATVLTVVVVAVVALIVIGVIAALAGRRTRMRHLSDESKMRYAQAWRAVEAKFVDDPAAAVRDADALAVSIYRERGATTEDARHLPDELQRAREAARVDEGRSETEGLRNAMLHYQRIVDDAVGERMRKSVESGHREVA